MPSEIEKLEGLVHRIKVTVPVEQVNSAYQKRLQELSKTVKMSGFRPGKVPKHVIENRYGTNLCQEVQGELMQSSFKDAMAEHQLNIAGAPKIEGEMLKKDTPLEYVATFEVYPEVGLKNLKDVAIEKTTSQVMDQDVDEVLLKIRKQHAKWSDVDREARESDRMIFDFEGRVDEQLFEGGSAKDFELELGSKQMIPGFEDGLIGMKAGETRDINVSFPKDYQAENLSGRAAVFKITAHKVQEPELPPLDDALADIIHVEGGLEGVRADVRQRMEKELSSAEQEQLKEQVIEKLLEQNPITVPRSLVDEEIRHLQQSARQEMTAYMQHSKGQGKDFEMPKELFEERAKRRVTLGLLLSEIIKRYKIELDKNQVQQKVQDLASRYNSPDEIVAMYYQNKRMLSEIEAAVLEEQAIAKLLEDANVSEKTVSYEEFTNPTKKPDEENPQ